jgi:hypothetical protein
MPPTRHAVVDVVELAADSGRWPAGTVGTVVEADDKRALVEISDDRGHALDLIALPHGALVPAGERRAQAIEHLLSISGGQTAYDFEAARQMHAERETD